MNTFVPQVVTFSFCHLGIITFITIYKTVYTVCSSKWKMHLVWSIAFLSFPCSSKAASNFSPRSFSEGEKHHGVPPLPRALFPRHLPLGEGQLHQELPLPLLRRLLCPGAGGEHALEGRCFSLHGHWRWVQSWGYFFQAGKRRPAFICLPRFQLRAFGSARHGNSLAPLTTASAKANSSFLLAPTERIGQEPMWGGKVRIALTSMVGLCTDNLLFFFLGGLVL